MMSKDIRRRTSRLPALVASLVTVAVLLVVPASLPLCVSDLGVCFVQAAEPAAAQCPLMAVAASVGEMDCCVSDAKPQGPSPAVPGKADADPHSHLQAQALPPAPGGVADAVPAALAPAPSPTAAPAASAVPLYTLLSTLLN